MRILSKFTDYYDWVSPLDKEPLYLRHTSELTDLAKYPEFDNLILADKPTKLVREMNFLINRIEYSTRYLFIAGKRYFGLQVRIPTPKYENASHMTELLLWQDIASRLPTEMAKYLPKADYEVWLARYQNNTSSFWDKMYVVNRRSLTKQQKTINIDNSVFRALNCPVFLADQEYSKFRVYLNPCLKDLQIHKFIEPTICYQMIDQYLGNQMAKQLDPDSSKTDIIARDAAGFDEWSFKNLAPGEKKVRRKLNKLKKNK